jgi:adenosylcobinamide-phosphate synthase
MEIGGIFLEIVYILAAALILDFIGEPPNILHPVVWMGKIIGFLIKFGEGRSHAIQFLTGLFVTLFTISLFSIPVYFLMDYLHQVNLILYVICGAIIFKPFFSFRALIKAAQNIRNLLKKDDLIKARFELRALVGRNTKDLDKSYMISATVESVAENICDSFFAPLFYFAFLGVPGAAAYRVINTLDAMIGHHGKYEYLGKFAAKLDTVVNFIPARLAAFFILISCWAARADTKSALMIMLSDSKKTESPNAGWTMSAMAGALGVRLEKIGFYILGVPKNPLTLQSINKSIIIVSVASFLWCGLIIIAEVIFRA